MSSQLSDVDVPFDCLLIAARPQGDEYQLTQVYRVARDLPLRTRRIGVYDGTDGGVSWVRTSIRRLRGLQLTATTTEDPPLTTVTDTGRKTALVRGFLGDVWTELENHLLFTTRYILYPDGSWGSERNWTWDGMIGQLIHGEADVAIARIVPTVTRARDVDFSRSLLTSGYNLVIRRPDSRVVGWTNALKPFSRGLWLTVLTTTAVLSVSMTTLGHRQKNANPGIVGAFFSVFGGMICGQGQAEVPDNPRCRPVQLLAYSTGVVLLAAYSAALVSAITSRHHEAPFESLQGLVDHGGYSVGVSRRSDAYYLFRNASSGLPHKVYLQLMSHDEADHPAITLEGLRRVCSIPNYAFIAPRAMVPGLATLIDCQVTILPETISAGSVQFAVRKHSPYLSVLNYNLQRMHGAGIIQRLKSLSINNRIADTHEQVVTVELADVVPMLAIVLAGVVVGVVVLMLEYMHVAVLKAKKDKGGGVRPRRAM